MPRIDNHCPHCGEYNGAKGDFCPRCGKKYTDPVTVITEPVYPIPEPKDGEEQEEQGGNKMKTILKILGGIIILAIIIFAAIFFLKGCQKTSSSSETSSIASSETSSIASSETSSIAPTPTLTPTPIIMSIDLSKAIGFTPDTNLLISDLKPDVLGMETASLAKDFNSYLNKPKDGFGPLAGYLYGTNDYNQYGDHTSSPQLPAYGWLIHTGLSVEMAGIGKVEGGPGRAALILIINRTDKVFRFPDHGVTVIDGFQGAGRIWDGNAKPIVETEKRLVNHYLTNLGMGIIETGFIGQTDQGAENASTITVVTVEMIKVGEFRLIRAETVPAIKK